MEVFCVLKYKHADGRGGTQKSLLHNSLHLDSCSGEIGQNIDTDSVRGLLEAFLNHALKGTPTRPRSPSSMVAAVPSGTRCQFWSEQLMFKCIKRHSYRAVLKRIVLLILIISNHRHP